MKLVGIRQETREGRFRYLPSDYRRKSKLHMARVHLWKQVVVFKIKAEMRAYDPRPHSERMVSRIVSRISLSAFSTIIVMVRPESWTRPTGVSPVRVGSGAPGSRPQSRVERVVAERGVKSLYGGSESAGRSMKRTLQPRQIHNGRAEPLISRRRPCPAGIRVREAVPAGSLRGMGGGTCSRPGTEQERAVCAAERQAKTGRISRW